jgi:hypothetical protein
MRMSGSKWLMGICLSVAMLSTGHGQEINGFGSLRPARNFTPVNLSLYSNSEGQKKPADNKSNRTKLAFWSACGGMPERGQGCPPCDRLTDRVPGHIGVAWCMQCHSCTTAVRPCPDVPGLPPC